MAGSGLETEVKLIVRSGRAIKKTVQPWPRRQPVILPAQDAGSQADSYCIVECDGATGLEEFTTPVHRDTKDPSWNYTCLLHPGKYPGKAEIKVCVWDKASHSQSVPLDTTVR